MRHSDTLMSTSMVFLWIVFGNPERNMPSSRLYWLCRLVVEQIVGQPCSDRQAASSLQILR